MKVLNFGSLNIDFVYNVDSFVIPGETISSSKLETFAGGKGLNQSVALANAGAEVYHAGCVGSDGKFLVELLESKGVNTDFLVEADEKNGHAIIQIDKTGQNCIILYGGTNQKITKEQVDSTLSYFSKGDILVLQNEINLNEYIMEKAAEKGMLIALNPSPFNEKIYNLPLDKVSFFLVNEIEGKCLSEKESHLEILKELGKKYNGAKIILTVGKKGVMAYDDGEIFSHGIYDVPVVDTTGAGDTFTGFFLSSYAKGKGMAKSLEIASRASALAITEKGAANAIPLYKEVTEAKLNPIE